MYGVRFDGQFLSQVLRSSNSFEGVPFRAGFGFATRVGEDKQAPGISEGKKGSRNFWCRFSRPSKKPACRGHHMKLAEASLRIWQSCGVCSAAGFLGTRFRVQIRAG